MLERWLIRVIAVTATAIVLSGCATTTLIARFGPLPGGRNLLTLLVTDDVDVVRQECAEVRTKGQVLGCQTSTPMHRIGALPVRAIKIVRCAETLPSALTFEIDAHELCHAVASLQLLRDPCHDGNGGTAQAAR
jgi:hypothetical protein